MPPGSYSSINANMVPPSARTKIIKVSPGNNYGFATALSLALSSDGKVFSLNSNGGFMGIVSENPVPDEAKNDIGDIFSAGIYGFVIKKNGKVIAWNSSGRTFITPQELENGVVKISATGSILLALKESGEVFAYSITQAPTAGIPAGPTYQTVLDPLEIPSEAKLNVVEIQANGLYVIKENGKVVSWNNTSPASIRELPNELNSDVSYVSDGLALKTNGEVISWSGSIAGAVLNSVPLEARSNIIKVTGSSNYALAMSKNGDVFKWDSLGTLLPIPDGVSGNVIDIYAPWTGNGPYYALKANGQLLKWFDFPNSIVSLPSEFSHSIPFIGGGDSGFVLSTSSDIAIQTYLGFPLDMLAQLVAEKIQNEPTNYGITTQSNLQKVLDITVSNLATKTELNSSLSQSRTDGINSVLSNPNLWTLYTTNQIKNMAIGDLVLTRTNNGQFVLTYDIEQSEDLANWTPYAGFAMPLTNLPTDKAFVRIKAKQ